ncbi:MAG: hypothetical protein QOF21_2201 [Actinomycetota bacterium]|jgi:hypothetical protein
MASGDAYSLNDRIDYEPTPEGRWIGRLALLDIEEFGDTEAEVAERVVSSMMAVLRAMPADEGKAWFKANTSFEPNPPFDAQACAAAYRDANPFPIDGVA